MRRLGHRRDRRASRRRHLRRIADLVRSALRGSCQALLAIVFSRDQVGGAPLSVLLGRAYPEPQHVVSIADEELSAFRASLDL
ncbi:hypothetical protein EJ070_32650 [Mesorhizobium sp. M1E.F.Ca.ET.045.02.1.1]|nr:hypothetical protein EJ070_32650 [Mesorhizobium sp. M1E.F.Ca.ET.045.02.1.1]